jgi:hypothetical protein
VINDTNVTRTLLRILAFVAAVLVALPSVAAPRAQYFCHMSGRVVDSSCCAPGSHEVSAPASTSEAQVLSNCCERLTPVKHSVPGKTSDTVHRLPTSDWVAVLCETPTSSIAPRELVTDAAPSARAPPELGPPLFIANCALLI